jgi:hypothetical protein
MPLLGVTVICVVISTTVKRPDPMGSVSVRVRSDTTTVWPDAGTEAPAVSVIVNTGAIEDAIVSAVVASGPAPGTVTVKPGASEGWIVMTWPVTLGEAKLAEGPPVAAPEWFVGTVDLPAGTVTVMGEPETGVIVTIVTLTPPPTTGVVTSVTVSTPG